MGSAAWFWGILAATAASGGPFASAQGAAPEVVVEGADKSAAAAPSGASAGELLLPPDPAAAFDSRGAGGAQASATATPKGPGTSGSSWGAMGSVGFAMVGYESRDLSTQRPARLTSQAALDLRLVGLRRLPHDFDVRLGAGLRALWLTQPDDKAVAVQTSDWILPRLVAGVHRRFLERASLGLALGIDRELFVTAISTQVLGGMPQWLVIPQLVGEFDILETAPWGLGVSGLLGYVLGVGEVNSGLSFAVSLRGSRHLSQTVALSLALGYGQKSQSTHKVQQTDRYLTSHLWLEWRP